MVAKAPDKLAMRKGLLLLRDTLGHVEEALVDGKGLELAVRTVLLGSVALHREAGLPDAPGMNTCGVYTHAKINEALGR